VGIEMQTELNPDIKIPVEHNNGIYRRFIKRPMDFILSLVAIIVLSPIFLIVSILVRTKIGSPVIFMQKRPGVNEIIFTLYKFRSMASPQDKEGNVLSDEQRLNVLAQLDEEDKLISDEKRLSKFGRIIRATSLDELPELFNILKGDMSFVGPRPLSTSYLHYYNEKEKLRHSVRPGLTGIAQVNGRNSITWDKRFAYDIEYVENITFKEDLRIVFKTFAVVFEQGDIGQAEEKPVPFRVVRQREWDAIREKNKNK
jgi:undecaprenyl phosphate N,N'-diacetylbacillosamine 1-phosphate transferase